MSSTALKTLAVILVVAAAILGFVAFRFSQGLTQPPETVETRPPQPGEDQVLAVVAVDRIPPYQPISKEAVALVPISVEPPQYYTDVSEVVGRTPLRPVAVGAPVPEEVFGNPNTLAHAIPPGTQAMSLEISEVIAVGGFVKPGDRVDVLVYIRSSGREVESSQSRVLLKDARVLTYQERMVNETGDSGQDDGRERRQRTAVVAVPENETTRVMLGASLGKLRLALRGAEDAEPEQTTRVADSGDGDGVQDKGKPEALSPQSAGGEQQQVAQSGGQSEAGGESEDEADDDNEEKVVTLEELAAVKEQQEQSSPTRAPRRPPRATIEVFQGTEASRISRPY